jgi:hypothetical protein
MSDTLSEKQIRSILSKGQSVSDADWVHSTRDHSLRTVYHMCQALRERPGLLLSFRDLHDIFRKNLRAAGLPDPPDRFNPVDHVSALWTIYEESKKLEGDFVPEVTELLARTPEDRKTKSKYNYQIRYKYHSLVDSVLDALHGTPDSEDAESRAHTPTQARELDRSEAEENDSADSRNTEDPILEEPTSTNSEPIIDTVVLGNIQRRRGQQSFRAALIDAYESQCAITRCSTIQVLEAAHIIPHSEQPSYSINAGILLRADVHTLFDLLLISINPESGQVVVSKDCGSDYADLEGAVVKVPIRAGDLPDPALLMAHFRKWQQRNHG